MRPEVQAEYAHRMHRDPKPHVFVGHATEATWREHPSQQARIGGHLVAYPVGSGDFVAYPVGSGVLLTTR